VLCKCRWCTKKFEVWDDLEEHVFFDHENEWQKIQAWIKKGHQDRYGRVNI